MCKKATNCRFDKAIVIKNGRISSRKTPSLNQKKVGNGTVAIRKKRSTNSKLSTKSEFQEGKVTLTLPLRTVSEANCFEHWRIKHERHRKQKFVIAHALKPVYERIKLPCTILLTRFAPNSLDKHDNLPMSFKYIVDAVCAFLTGEYKAGKADSDERISIAYDQVESPDYGIKIEIIF